MRDELLDLGLRNSLLRPQFDFIPGSSCCHQLIVYLDKITRSVDECSCVDAIYIDLAKAFNAVSHSKLLATLCSLGVGGCLLRWLESFLRGRKEVVSVLGEFSLPYTM